MLFKKWFGPKVCGELYNQLLQEYQDMELELSRAELRTNAVALKSISLNAQIKEWAVRYYRLKLTFGVTMTDAPKFEDYAADMELKNQEIERLNSMVHELSFKNNELEAKLEKNSLKAMSSKWGDNNMKSNTEHISNVTPYNPTKRLKST